MRTAQTLALLITAASMALAPVRADDRVADPLAAAPALPLASVTPMRTVANWELATKALGATFGFDVVWATIYPAIPGLSPAAAEMQALEDGAYPYGRFRRLNGLTRENVRSAGQRTLGVEVLRDVWSPRPDGTSGWPVCTRATVWRWDAPKDMHMAWPQWSYPGQGARHAALCAVPPSWAKDVRLMLFDALTPAPKWDVVVPFRETYRDYCSRTGQTFGRRLSLPGVPHMGYTDRTPEREFWDFAPLIYPAVTHDASRVLVAAGYTTPYAGFLFVYDASGTLLRTLEFPGRRPFTMSGPEHLLRSPTEPLFALHLQRQQPGVGEPADEFYLVNGEGDVLGRFVDEKGKPVRPDKLSNTHAYAKREDPDGTYTEFIISLKPTKPG